MSDIAAQRPAAGAPIESAWGGQVHDAVEGMQAGTVVISGITSSAAGVGTVVYPRPYATKPVVVISGPSNVVIAGSDPTTQTVTGFNISAKRADGSGTAYSGTFSWIAIGTVA